MHQDVDLLLVSELATPPWVSYIIYLIVFAVKTFCFLGCFLRIWGNHDQIGIGSICHGGNHGNGEQKVTAGFSLFYPRFIP